MNKLKKEDIIILIFIIVMILFTIYLGYLKKNELENVSNINTGNDTQLTGISENISLSGNVINEVTDEELYIKYFESGNKVSFYPQKQGNTNGDFATNSQFMIDYLTKNTFNFNLTNKFDEGYLYIRLNKHTDSKIFVYFDTVIINGYKVSGNLDSSKSLIKSDNEYLYKLSDIPYFRYNDNQFSILNWQNYLKVGERNSIALFVRDYDGSTRIENITIVWNYNEEIKSLSD